MADKLKRGGYTITEVVAAVLLLVSAAGAAFMAFAVFRLLWKLGS